MYKFVLVEDIRFPQFGKFWMHMVDSELALAEFLAIHGKHLVQEYFKAKEILRNNRHFDSAHQSVIHNLFECQVLAGKERKDATIVTDILDIHDTFLTPYEKVFRDFGAIVVNQVGGFRPYRETDLKIHETVEKEEYSFPIEKETNVETALLKVKYIKWENGTHWYAKLGNTDIVWNGEQKWNSKWDAKQAARKYLEKNLTA